MRQKYTLFITYSQYLKKFFNLHIYFNIRYLQLKERVIVTLPLKNILNFKNFHNGVRGVSQLIRGYLPPCIHFCFPLSPRSFPILLPRCVPHFLHLGVQHGIF